MKKIVLNSVLLLALLLLVAGCASAPTMTKEERFDALMLSTSDFNYADADTKGYIEMAFNSPELEQPVEMSFTAEGFSLMDYSDKNNLKMYTKMNTTIMGASIDMVIYYKDNYQYIDAMGLKMKTALPASEMLQSSNISPIIMSASDMESLTMEMDGSNYVFTYKVSEEGLDSYFEQISSLVDDLQLDMTGDVSIKINRFEGTITGDKKNTLRAMTVVADMDIVIEGIAVPVYMESDTTYNSFNKPLTIDFPSFDEYIELPAE